MVNLTVIQGRLTRDPEIRTTNNGISVANFTVAWNRKINDDNEKVLYMECEAWRGTAELVSKHYHKGQEIIVEGELYTNTYQNENGENRHTIRLLVNQIHFTIGNKSQTSNDNTVQTFEPVSDSNLPF